MLSVIRKFKTRYQFAIIRYLLSWPIGWLISRLKSALVNYGVSDLQAGDYRIQ